MYSVCFASGAVCSEIADMRKYQPWLFVYRIIEVMLQIAKQNFLQAGCLSSFLSPANTKKS